MKLRILLAICTMLIVQACKKNQKDLIAESAAFAGTAPTPCNTCGLTKTTRVLPADTIITTTLTLCPDITYVLAGKLWIQNGGKIVIPAGTVIKGRKHANPIFASALVVTKGGKIEANGSASCPVIFTSESDSINGFTKAGDWGGVVILGKSSVGTPTGSAVAEGFGPSVPAGIDITYGGTMANDNSGFMRYVRIQYAGAALGPHNELNCLSLYGVGAATELDHIETFKGLDNGFRFFGGTVNAKYLLAVSNGDDQFDFEQGYRGNLQYLVAINQSGDSTYMNPGCNGIKSGSWSRLQPGVKGGDVDEFGSYWLRAIWIAKQ